MQVDVLIDSKSLYDLITGIGEPKPADEGSRLYIVWARERRPSGAIRRMIWVCTQDELSDILTKKGVEPRMMLMAMNGELRLRYSSLADGVLLSPEKGLPPPKTQKDPAAALFCQLWQEAENSIQKFLGLVQQHQGALGS